MTQQFNKSLILQPKTVVHCTTEQQAITLLNWADSIGLKWLSGDSYRDKRNFYLEEETCYYLNNGLCSSYDYCKIEGYTILSYDEVILRDELPVITTHTQLLSHARAKVTCYINGNYINDARIRVEDDGIYICQNVTSGCECENKLGYRYSWHTSRLGLKYETNDQDVTNIQLVENDHALLNENNQIIKIQEEGTKMTGVAELGVITIAKLIKDKVEVEQVLANVLSADRDNRTVKTTDGVYENVISLRMEEGSLLYGFDEGKVPKVKVIDDRAEWVKYKTVVAEINAKYDCRLIDEIEYDIKTAGLRKKYEGVTGRVEYTLVWE